MVRPASESGSTTGASARPRSESWTRTTVAGPGGVPNIRSHPRATPVSPAGTSIARRDRPTTVSGGRAITQVVSAADAVSSWTSLRSTSG